MSSNTYTLYVDHQYASPYAMSAFVTLVEKGVDFELRGSFEGEGAGHVFLHHLKVFLYPLIGECSVRIEFAQRNPGSRPITSHQRKSRGIPSLCQGCVRKENETRTRKKARK